MVHEVDRNNVKVDQSKVESDPNPKTQKSSENGRAWSDESKNVSTTRSRKATTIMAGVGLGLLGVASLIMLVVGVILLVNPAGFGIGNAAGAALSTISVTLGTFVTNAAEWMAINALFLTIFGAVGSVITAGGVTALTIASKKSIEEGSDSEEGTDFEPEKGEKPEDEDIKVEKGNSGGDGKEEISVEKQPEVVNA